MGMTNPITVRRMECDRNSGSAFGERVRVSVNRGVENPAPELGRLRFDIGTTAAKAEA